MYRPLLLACGCTLLFGLSGAQADTPAAWTKSHLPELIEIYRGFHRAPELSSQEAKTAATLADYLKKLGCEVQSGIGGHGVAAILKNGPGPTLMVRTDLDALPVTEKNGLVYSSQEKFT
jgi:metal-dependent amidase/aminoacylase/carboxypeptidase family protein